jgi:hypothetical protein
MRPLWCSILISIFLLPAATGLAAVVSSSRRRDAVASVLLLFAPPPPAYAAMYDNGPVRRTDGIDTTTDVTLPSGVNFEDLRLSDDIDRSPAAVKIGDRVNLQWSLKRSNGYSVDGSANNDGVPFIFTVGDPNGAIQGVDQGVRGMRLGGIRRILIPPQLAYVDGVDDGKVRVELFDITCLFV